MARCRAADNNDQLWFAPPQDLILRDDHAGLARWYEYEATKLREKAAEMQRMMEEYAKLTYTPSPKHTKDELITHCQLFIKLYAETAREAEALAKLHRDLDKPTSWSF